MPRGSDIRTQPRSLPPRSHSFNSFFSPELSGLSSIDGATPTTTGETSENPDATPSQTNLLVDSPSNEDDDTARTTATEEAFTPPALTREGAFIDFRTGRWAQKAPGPLRLKRTISYFQIPGALPSTVAAPSATEHGRTETLEEEVLQEFKERTGLEPSQGILDIFYGSRSNDKKPSTTVSQPAAATNRKRKRESEIPPYDGKQLFAYELTRLYVREGSHKVNGKDTAQIDLSFPHMTQEASIALRKGFFQLCKGIDLTRSNPYGPEDTRKKTGYFLSITPENLEAYYQKVVSKEVKHHFPTLNIFGVYAFISYYLICPMISDVEQDGKMHHKLHLPGITPEMAADIRTGFIQKNLPVRIGKGDASTDLFISSESLERQYRAVQSDGKRARAV